jgi:hypothetical protein
MQDKFNIESKEAYDVTMREIDGLMKNGENNLTECEANELREMAEAAERFEDKHLFIERRK